ncbi:MAG: MFS transporter [Trueperaceae bacterium]|nr:MFS transporter [Trueperaceae bacterium]
MPVARNFLNQCLASGLMTMASSMMAVMLPLYAVSLGVGAQWLGVLMALPGIFPVVLALPAGRWVDAVGAPRWFLLGLVGLTFAPLGVVAFPGVAALAASRLLLGFFYIFFTLASQSLVAALGNGRSHESNFAVHSTWLAGGRMVGPVLAGVIIDVAGYRAGYGAVFVVLLGAAAFGLAVARGAPAVAPGHARGAARRRGAVLDTLRNVGLQMAVLTSAGVFLAITMREAFLPVMLEQLGMSATVIGALVSLGSLTSVLIRPIMPLVTRALGGTGNSLVVSMLAVAFGVGMLSAAHSVWAFAALAVVVGFGTGIAFPLSIVAVASHVPVVDRGVALSLRLSINHTVEVFAPTLSGLVVAATSFRFGFASAGLALGALTLLSLSILPRFNAGAVAADAPAQEMPGAEAVEAPRAVTR